jgi:predicted RNase H-like nuclease
MRLITGIDGCPSGWLAITRDIDGGAVRSQIYAYAIDLLDQHVRPEIITIDIPIGLTDRDPRQCDVLARKALGVRASSVFPAPLRATLSAKSYEQACDTSHAASGKKISKQAWMIYPKIREIDALVRSNTGDTMIREVHPEVCFWAWNGGRPMSHPKRTPEGRAQRLELVGKHFGDGTFQRVRAKYPRDAAADDDILDALAALWTAERIARGEARTLPETPPRDSIGIPMEMVY